MCSCEESFFLGLCTHFEVLSQFVAFEHKLDLLRILRSSKEGNWPNSVSLIMPQADTADLTPFSNFGTERDDPNRFTLNCEAGNGRSPWS